MMSRVDALVDALARRFGGRARATARALGFALAWGLAWSPARACACAGGAYAGGLASVFACVLGATRARGSSGAHGLLDAFAVGMALGVFPATLTGSTAGTGWAKRGAVTRARARTDGLDPDAGAADAISLVDVTVGDFRFDLMGELHATLPMEDETYIYKAGAEASGTFCAVPVTHANWTITQPVPFWYVCDNFWAGHRNCTDAYEKNYDDEYGWYGLRALHTCLRSPIDALERGATELHFLHLDFQQSFEPKYEISEKALLRASVQHEVSVDINAPRVYWNPIQEPCCDALASQTNAVLTAVTILSLLPLVYLTFRDLLRPLRSASMRDTTRAFYTRAELLKAANKGPVTKVGRRR